MPAASAPRSLFMTTTAVIGDCGSPIAPHRWSRRAGPSHRRNSACGTCSHTRAARTRRAPRTSARHRSGCRRAERANQAQRRICAKAARCGPSPTITSCASRCASKVIASTRMRCPFQLRKVATMPINGTPAGSPSERRASSRSAGAKRPGSMPVGIELTREGATPMSRISCVRIASPVVTISAVALVYSHRVSASRGTGAEMWRVRTSGRGRTASGRSAASQASVDGRLSRRPHAPRESGAARRCRAAACDRSAARSPARRSAVLRRRFAPRAGTRSRPDGRARSFRRLRSECGSPVRPSRARPRYERCAQPLTSDRGRRRNWIRCSLA